MSLGELTLAFSAFLSALLAVHAFWFVPRRVERQRTDALAALSEAVELRFPAYEGLVAATMVWCADLAEAHGLCRDARRRLEAAAHVRFVGLCELPFRMLNDRSPSEWSRAERMAFALCLESAPSVIAALPSFDDVTSLLRVPAHGEPAPIESVLLAAATRRTLESIVSADAWPAEALGEPDDPRMASALARVLTSPCDPEHTGEVAVA